MGRGDRGRRFKVILGYIRPSLKENIKKNIKLCGAGEMT